MKTAKKIISPILTILFIAIIIGEIRAREVDVDEVLTKKKVIFQNFRGKYRKQDTKSQIKNIGSKLAAGTEKAGANKKFRVSLKYSMIHAFSKKETDKFSADIMSIDRNAKIGHVNAIRLILEGYLEKMYGYSNRHAKTLSVFITYYNAVYRKNLTYFKSKYKSVVTRHLSKRNAGLSTKYYRWPGRSKIIIPLTEDAKRGKLDSIDPNIISDKKIRDRIRKDDKNIEDRKNLVDIKKKIIEKDKKSIKKEKKIVEDKKRIVEDKERRIEREKKKIIKEKEKAREIKDPERRKRREEEIKKKEDRIIKDDKKTTEEKKTIEEEGKEVKKKEDEISKKEEDLKKEEKEIKEDEIKKEIKDDPETARKKLEKKADELAKREEALKEEKKSKNIFGDKLYYMKINHWLKNGHYDNDLFLINAATRKVVKKSPVVNIAGRKYDIFKDGVVIITHLGNYEANHRLTLIDKDTLEAKIFGTDNIFFRSFVEIRGNYIFAILIENNKYYLGKFDNNLKLVSKSKDEIHEDSFITFFSDYIYINRKDRRIIVINKEDMKLIEVIKP